MKNVPAARSAGTGPKVVLAFVTHELVATLGVIVMAPLLVAILASALHLFGVTLYMREFHRILTETPYFPVQSVFALFLGWIIGRRGPDRAMLWVWVPPAVALAVLFVTNHHVMDFSLASSTQVGSRVSHFFGWGCRPQQRCFDQIFTTLPFYSSVSYAVGGLLARAYGRTRGPRGTRTAEACR